MKSLRLLNLFKNLTVVSLNREVHFANALLARSFRKNYFQNSDPGLRHRKKALQDDPELANEIDIDNDINEEVDVMNIENAYDLMESEKKKENKRTQYRIIKQKFFSERPQPLMLTCNERHCIRYLHKQDPVQWDYLTLSNNFPATPDTIKKIVKSKWKITPERAKLLDAKAQANWELLAQGKLDADERVLEHMRKFINRREVLLEQIKNEKFYLPEIKKETVWNNGEFSNVLARYEKTIKKLVDEAKGNSNQTLLEGGKTAEEKSSLELVHEKIKEAVSHKRFEEKDSFLFSGLRNSYSKPTTLKNLEYDILKKADQREELSVFDKAILENELGFKPQDIEYKYNSKTLTEANSEAESKSVYKPGNMDTDYNYNLERLRETKSEAENRLGYKPQNVNFNRHSERIPEFDFNEIERASEEKTMHKLNKNLTTRKIKNWEESIIEQTMDEDQIPHDKTQIVHETEIGKLLGNLKSEEVKLKQEEKEEEVEIEIDFAGKLEIDFSDPVRIERENIFYDKEVKDIEDTAFWNSGHNSQKKAMLEEQKKPHSGPPIAQYDGQLQTSVLSSERYPEKIKIPKSKWKKGLTFKVKDCYYDDDGQFLYRVPGMVK